MPKTITESARVNAPIDRVFAALTTPAELLQWWTDPMLCVSTEWEMDLRVGGIWRSRWRWTADGKEFELGGTVLEVDAPRLLVVTWVDERYRGVPATTVRYELTPLGDATEVRVIHSGFDDVRADFDDYNGGWSSVLAKVQRFIERVSVAG